MVPPTIPTFPQFLAASALCILPSRLTMSDQDRFPKSAGVLRSLEKKLVHRKALSIAAEKRWLCWCLLPSPPSGVLVCDKMMSAVSLGPPALFSFEMTMVCLAGVQQKGFASFLVGPSRPPGSNRFCRTFYS